MLVHTGHFLIPFAAYILFLGPALYGIPLSLCVLNIVIVVLTGLLVIPFAAAVMNIVCTELKPKATAGKGRLTKPSII